MHTHLPRCAFSYTSARIDNENLVSHVNLGEVHIIQHLLGSGCPHLVISAVSEETDGNDDIPFKGEFLLHAKEVVLESRAAA